MANFIANPNDSSSQFTNSAAELTEFNRSFNNQFNEQFNKDYKIQQALRT